MLTHFAPLVYGVAIPSGEIEICNAGHCFPLLIKEDSVKRIESTGFPLGMFCGGQFSTKKVKLALGDSLFLYSDGLSEARNGSNILYGNERLISLIGKKKEATPYGLVEACHEDLENFQSGFPMSDDLTMMAIQRVNL